MAARIFSPADHHAMPWKNGLGTTREIAAARTEEDLRSGGFAWRLSIAEVTVGSPFSIFAGCDRTILLLDGDGMILDSGEHGRHVLSRRFAPYAFSGDWPTDCKLLGGPCRDFNVMADRRRVRTAVNVLPVDKSTQEVNPDGDTVALFALSAAVYVTTKYAAQTYELPPQYTLLLTAETTYVEPFTIESRDGEALILSIVFARISG